MLFWWPPYSQAACRARPALHLSWLGLCVLHQAHLCLTLFGLGAKNHSPVASKWWDCRLWLPRMVPSSAQPPPGFTLTESRFGLAWALGPLWYEGAGIPLKASLFPPWRESHRMGCSSHYCDKTPKQSAHTVKGLFGLAVWGTVCRGRKAIATGAQVALDIVSSVRKQRHELSLRSPPSKPCSECQPVEWCYPL